MDQETIHILKNRLNQENYQKLMRIHNPKLHQFIASYLDLCNPVKVFVCTDSAKDIQYMREAAVTNREEAELAIRGHTVHFDGYYDQARDKEKTRLLVPRGVSLGPVINAMDRGEGIKEIRAILKNIMDGRELYVKFFCLGPTNSEFTILCVQLTDSSYVAHSEDLLYRQGYGEFLRLGNYERFFKIVHSQGELTEAGLGLCVSKNIEKRRIYIDLQDETIYSANTQYGGNTIGLKKLAMRLAINRASKEGWLVEHMLIMGVYGPRGRVSYFTGAFPSMCGKTSTAMVEGETIVGDDIAYLRKIGGKCRAVNVEKGVFGIIEGINSTDDPLQWKALHKQGEIIFSNVLVTEDRSVYWTGKDGEVPKKGINYSGEWFLGKQNREGKEISPSHRNARFTFDLKILDNVDPKLHDPEGVIVSGIIYGGRNCDTSVPVEEAFDWVHGVIAKGAALESETTAATLEKEGVRVFNPMSNMDFLSISIGRYIENNLNFGVGLDEPPRIFCVNYFLKDSDGAFVNHKSDKRVWLKWMELRVRGDVDAIITPTGLIPKYQDLKRLFKETLNKGYPEQDYIKQFTMRVPENLAKIDRLIEIYNVRVLDTPQIVFKILEEQRERLKNARAKYGDYVSPDKF
ncbi:phosphoenolpyruvate carboxykinase (GTP) [Candidatus Aerophobetes bacterium]|uniref:Phosphoenolpyruvate carboxykinase [GTP] n=1 Tax=Aerophobetes bacterium TaxID=2030807 RepID=A0A523UKN2_UNCAE|nr:MAG: phosphoenolpyruvate carboxykinase (GTP) [Candidatus Aerophobetes bacterium]